MTPRPSADDLAVWSNSLENAPADQIVQWAVSRFGSSLTLASGFGVEGCVLIDVMARASLNVDTFTLDTGLLFPETYALWDALEARYGIVIRGIDPASTVEEQAEREGSELWARDPDRCCNLRKVDPLRGVLSQFNAWMTAVRREQTPDRTGIAIVGWDDKFGLVKVNPLAQWTRREVWRYVHEFAVPYNRLHDAGYPSIGCVPCTSRVAEGEDERAGRWRGTGKRECGLHQR